MGQLKPGREYCNNLNLRENLGQFKPEKDLRQLRSDKKNVNKEENFERAEIRERIWKQKLL